MPLYLSRTLTGSVVLSFLLLLYPSIAIGQEQQKPISNESQYADCAMPVDKPHREEEALVLLKMAIQKGQVQTRNDSPLIFRGTSLLTDAEGSKGETSFSVTQSVKRRSREETNSAASNEQKNSREVQRFIYAPYQRPIKELIPVIKGDIEDENQIAVWTLAKDEQTVTIRVSPVLKSHNSITIRIGEPVIDLTFDKTSNDVIKAAIRPIGCEGIEPGALKTTLSYSDFREFGARRLPAKITSIHGKEQRVQVIESVEEAKN